MEIKYNDQIEKQQIDIDKLRPNNSYDYLIKNRNAAIQDILDNKKKLSELTYLRNCPVCDMKDYKKIISKDNMDIVKCSECDIVYVNPIFDEKKYIELYKTKDYQNIVQKLGEDSHQYRKERFGKERCDNIAKYHDNKLPKTLLEIGCSTGFVIEEASERGWQATGVELNPSAVAFARKRGLNVIDKPLEEINFNKKFSAVALYDVLEHLTEPKSFFEKIYSLLEYGGNVFIYVPNFNSASIDLLGAENAHFIWPTHHLTYFTPITLENFLKQFNMNILYWETQGLDIVDWTWYMKNNGNYDMNVIEDHLDILQFYINAAGHGKNLRMYARKVK